MSQSRSQSRSQQDGDDERVSARIAGRDERERIRVRIGEPRPAYAVALPDGGIEVVIDSATPGTWPCAWLSVRVEPPCVFVDVDVGQERSDEHRPVLLVLRPGEVKYPDWLMGRARRPYLLALAADALPVRFRAYRADRAGAVAEARVVRAAAAAAGLDRVVEPTCDADGRIDLRADDMAALQAQQMAVVRFVTPFVTPLVDPRCTGGLGVSGGSGTAADVGDAGHMRLVMRNGLVELVAVAAAVLPYDTRALIGRWSGPDPRGVRLLDVRVSSRMFGCGWDADVATAGFLRVRAVRALVEEAARRARFGSLAQTAR